jgi:AcrR family transcriptional regulator
LNARSSNAPLVIPRSPATNEQLRAASRARILEHALALFAQHGYERTSVKMIAESAGVAQGLLYNYFASKDALLRAIFEESMRDVRESFRRAERAGPPERRVEALLRASFDILRRNQRFWRLSYGVRMQPAVLAGLGEDVFAWTAAVRRTLEGYLAEAGVRRPEVEAAVLFALIDGVSQHYVLDPEHYPLDAVTEVVVARYRAAASRR